jgi:uncharacterized Zn-binding protein involved in type VI secretion
MPAAARTSDKTEHAKMPLGPGPGSPNVYIGGLPAWRAGIDTHICPQSDGPTKPHLGGMVSVGSSKVFINGFQAARKGDTILEAGQQNSISEGCEKVQIGG